MPKQTTTRKDLWTFMGKFVMVGEIKKFTFASPDYYRQMTAKAPLEKEIAVTFSTKTPTRSQSQLAYYWVLMRLVAEHTGYTTQEAHNWVMVDAFGLKDVTIGDRTLAVRRSIANVAKMPKYDAMKLIDHVLTLCADLEINVPTMESLGYISNT